MALGVYNRGSRTAAMPMDNQAAPPTEADTGYAAQLDDVISQVKDLLKTLQQLQSTWQQESQGETQ